MSLFEPPKFREKKTVIKDKPATKKTSKLSFKDKIIKAIIDYEGLDPDLISLRDNWVKKGHNGDYSRRHVLNTIKIIEEEVK